MGKELTCIICGTKFIARNYHNNAVTCSRSCHFTAISNTLKKPITWVENWEPAKIAGLDSPCHECNSHTRGTKKYIKIWRDGKSISLHRFIYQQGHNKTLPPDIFVRHKCDNMKCINILHLIEGTVKDNAEDALRRGRTLRGEKAGPAKLTESDVVLILRSPLSHAELGRMFNVNSNTIGCIRKRKSWKHVII